MTKQTPIQLLEARVTQLEKLTQFHDISYKQVIGQHYDIELLKTKTNATNVALSEIKTACLDLADSLLVSKQVKPKEKPSHAMVEAYWLSCFAWLLIGIVLTLAALSFAEMLK